MLAAVKSDLEKYYYDPTFRGMSVPARFKEAEEKIKQATSIGQAFGIIAQVLLDLDDSHTFFIPPSRPFRTDYGWQMQQMQMIGDVCHVIAVKPGSDADAKGLKAGDVVYTVDGYGVERSNIWRLHYLYYSLRPKPGMRVVVQLPGGNQKQMDVIAKVKQGKAVYELRDIGDLIRESENEDRLHRHRYYEFGDDLMIWKMPQFDLDDKGVDDMIDKARKRKALILDLRGNGGGAVPTLQRLVGSVFDRDIKIADEKARKETKPQLAKTRGDRSFKGKLVVLIDSDSGSAAEVFARVVQLEKRGTVLGDRSAGAVMESQHESHQAGSDTVVFYSVSVTHADLIMTDGKSLEHDGVIPDELLLPSAADIAAKRDPVLSRAAAVVGFNLPPEKAGTLFPIEWRK